MARKDVAAPAITAPAQLVHPIATQVLKRRDALASIRMPWEAPWQDCVDLCLPMHDEIGQGFGARANYLTNGPQSDIRGRKIYDSAGVVGVDRLSSGVEALVTPQSEKWHGLETDDPFAPPATDLEKEWYDGLTDYLFKVRYDTRSGFVGAHQKALRSTVALGTGIVYTEECMGMRGVSAAQVPIRYQHVPLNECFIATDRYGNPNTNLRDYARTASQLVEQFGEEKVSREVRECFKDPTRRDKTFRIIHMVEPRDAFDIFLPEQSIQNSVFSSVFIEAETSHLLGRGGFFEFPFSIYYWHDQGKGYSESAVMFALAELKSLQVMGKTGMRMLGQMSDPPLAIAHDGVTNRPNLNPRAINPNALTEEGNLKIKPILTAQMPREFWEVITGKRELVKEALYLNLFQTLVQRTGQITATEALIKANEKGELLGPAGSKIQTAMAHMIDRELGILARKGLYDPDSPKAPPPTLRGRSFGTKMTGPLDRIRRSKELLGATNTVTRAVQLQPVIPDIMDNIDGDYFISLSQEIEGAPRKILKQDAVRDKIRAERNAAAAQQQQIADGQQMGAAMEQGARGVQAIGEVAGGPGGQGMAQAMEAMTQ